MFKRIESENELSMVDVQHILNDEFNVEFSLPHVCNIVRKLGFDYIQSNNNMDEDNYKKSLIKIK